MYEEKTLTGYPSIDKPWLKYYSSDYVNLPLPECKIFDYCYEENKNNIPEYARPVEFKVIDRLPVTPIGKVDYRALEKLAEEYNNTYGLNS